MHFFITRRRFLNLMTIFSIAPFAEDTKAYYGAPNINNFNIATGGGDGKKVYINNVKELENNLAGHEAATLVINRNIKTPSKHIVFIGSNKTLVGLHSGIIINNIYLVAHDNAGNVIIKDLVFIHDRKINANNDIQLRVSSGTRYLINNCKFMGHEWSLNEDAEDKLIYFGDNADYVVICNCVFANHKYGCIFGHPEDGRNQFKGKPNVIIYNNFYINVYVRAPGLFRYGNFSVYNNHIKNFHLGFTVDGGAKVYSSNNMFNTKQQYFSILDYKNGDFISKHDMLNGREVS